MGVERRESGVDSREGVPHYVRDDKGVKVEVKVKIEEVPHFVPATAGRLEDKEVEELRGLGGGPSPFDPSTGSG